MTCLNTQGTSPHEKSPFYPRSPYAAAKVYVYWMTVNYREGYNLFACNGILFNHESPRRGETFVTRKITRAIANIIAGRQKKLYIGNLDARRDWGFAPEYVICQWLMLQQDEPDDYVIGTGESHSVREFIELAFRYSGIEIEWRGEGIKQKGIIHSFWGTGKPTREFLYVEDCAEAIVLATERYNKPEPVNIGAGFEISIKDLVGLIAKLTGFKGEIRWDTTRPDGQPRRMLDTSKAEKEFGFKAKISLKEGLKKTIEWYRRVASMLDAH